MDITELAKTVNDSFTYGRQSECVDTMVKLYEEVQKNKGVDLINLKHSNLQTVGLAFVLIALRLKSDSDSINEVAAENSYFCLAKSYITDNDKTSLPGIFNIFQIKPKLLSDVMITYWKDAKNNNIELSMSFMEEIQFFLLNSFFDIEKKEYLIPTDFIYMLPPKEEINKFLDHINSLENFNNEIYISEGKKHFKAIYHICEQAVLS
ncbi:MAG: hypothetical protein WCS34_05540 [Bacteroidales bacterium]